MRRFLPQAQGGWRIAALLLLTLALLGALLAGGEPVEAHAFLDRSDPPEGAVLNDPPAGVRLWFTEPVEPQFTSAQLFDAEGVRVETETSFVDPNDRTLVHLPTPPDLPAGTYTIQWQNVSAVDGHPQSGYLPFTIGTTADVVVPVPPPATTFTEPPTWLAAIGRWLSLLGATGAAGALVCWFWVIRFARDPLPEELQDRIQGRVVTLVLASVGVAIVGSLIVLSVQSASSRLGYGPTGMLDIAADTRWGHYWIARVVLLLVLAGVALTDSVWDDPPNWTFAGGVLGLCGAIFVPFSLISHSAVPGEGRAAAVVADWLHIAATSVWIGGLLALLVTVVYGARGAGGAARRESYAIAIPRFTTMAIISVVILALTGLYAGWLHVGNLTALRETSYGQTLIVKLVLIVPLLVLGAVNMRVLGPRMRDSARSGRHFGRTIAAEAMLGIGILFTVGLLTSLPTARETISAEAERSTFHFTNETAHAVLHVSPGSVGNNLYTADIAFARLPDSELQRTTVLLRMENADGTIEGVQEATLLPAFGNRFQASGSQLSVVGAWNLELIVRHPDLGDTRFTTTMDVPRTPPAERVPGQPPRFASLTAAAAVLFIALGVVAVILVLRLPAFRRDRMVGTLMSAGLVVAGLLVLFVTRVEPRPTSALRANPIPISAESVAIGAELFQQHCVACHGPEGEGDGPLAPTLSRPPANLHEPHVAAHTDGDLHWWIENGIPPNMPGFGDDLTDEQMWHLVNFVRSLRNPVVGESE